MKAAERSREMVWAVDEVMAMAMAMAQRAAPAVAHDEQCQSR